MKYGYYADDEIPKSVTKEEVWTKNLSHYKTNSFGYRCPEFYPLPEGRKNVVILGCSHTFGEGLEIDEIWTSRLEQLLDKHHNLRFWNLAQPGASPDKCVRILYGSEKVLFPKIIIVCWPMWSRRERLDNETRNLMGYDILLKTENDYTDRNNFLKCVFQVEKFSQYNRAKTFHCFAQDVYDIPNNNNVFADTSIKSCWPVWDKHHLKDAKREHIDKPNLARDGVHYGVEHHRVFAEKFYAKFGPKLK